MDATKVIIDAVDRFRQGRSGPLILASVERKEGIEATQDGLLGEHLYSVRCRIRPIEKKLELEVLRKEGRRVCSIGDGAYPYGRFALGCFDPMAIRSPDTSIRIKKQGLV